MVTPDEWEHLIQGALGLSDLAVTRKQMQKQSFGLTLSFPRPLFPHFVTQRTSLGGCASEKSRAA